MKTLNSLVLPLLLASSLVQAECYKGDASYYAHPFHGRTTANGETYNMWALTAAHKTLPFGTKVKVKNLINGKTVTVRINDRGPFIKGRIIDLSKKAMQAIGAINTGVVPVKVCIK